MKLVRLLLALLLTILTIGGLLSAAHGADGASAVGDLVISALLGAAAIACWRRVGADRDTTDQNGTRRPWQR